MGPYGPRVPSVVGPVILVCVGIIALLVVTGHIGAGSFWEWYGHWWPVLLIGAGLALLGEWALDMRRKTPVRRSGSFIGILVVLAVLGALAAGYNHFRGPWNGFGDNDWFNFGMPEHDYDQPADNRAIPANASIQIVNPRGDVSVIAADQPNLDLQAHEIAYANSDSDAKKIFDAEAAQVTISGNAVTIQSANNDKGRVNLSITVPRTAKVTVNAGKGDVTASGLGAGIDVTAPGDIHLNSIVGPVVAHFINGRHDEFSAHDVQGDLTLNGDLNDLTLSQIKGSVTQDGALLGDVHLENVSGAVRLHTSVTTVELAGLSGDLNLDSDDLRVTEATGQVRVTTHSKDIDLSEIAGDTYVEDKNGTINIEPTGSYGVEARNDKGDIELTLPPNVSANVNGHTHNGDIISDYALTVSGDEDKSVSGKIGSGTARIVLNTQNGDLHIKKGDATPPPVPAAPGGPAPPKAPHLKSPKPVPPQPVTQ